MKKIALFALAALCTAAAQAATLSWTEGKGFDVTSATGDITIVLTIKAPTTGFDYESAANGTSVFDLGGIAFVRDNWNGNNTGKFVFGDVTQNVGGHTSTTRLNGNVIYTMAFTDYNAETKTWNKLTLSGYWANGAMGADVYPTGPAGLTYDVLADATTFTSGLGFTFVDAQLIGENVVPEPTALALLALGVAGLALKRKNA